MFFNVTLHAETLASKGLEVQIVYLRVPIELQEKDNRRMREMTKNVFLEISYFL